jgi:hypothetical protein
MTNCTEPNRAACPRLCSDFCNAKEVENARRSAADCSPSYDKAAHDKAWEKNFVLPLGREMKKRGIRYMVMILRDDGKLAYTLDTKIPGENSQDH